MLTQTKNLNYGSGVKEDKMSDLEKLIASFITEEKEDDENLIDAGDTASVFNSKDMPPIIAHESIYVVHDAKTYSPQLNGVQKALDAHDILALNNYEHQRPFIRRRLEELIRKQADGRHHGGEIAIAVFNGFKYVNPKTKQEHSRLLVNGQHTSALSLATKKPILATYKEFAVTQKEQIPVLWAQFDQPGGNRTRNQVAKAYTEQFPGWSERAITLLSGAHVYFLSTDAKDKKKSVTVDESIESLLSVSYRNNIHSLLFDNNGRHDYPHIHRVPVVSAIFSSFEENRNKAIGFWGKVKTGVDCAANSPELTLRNLLLSIKMGGESSIGRQKKIMAAYTIYNACQRAWEACLNNEPLKRIHKKTKNKSGR